MKTILLTLKMLLAAAGFLAYTYALATTLGGTGGGSGDGGGRTVEVPKFTTSQYTGQARTLTPAPDLSARKGPSEAAPRSGPDAIPVPPYPFPDDAHVLIATSYKGGVATAVFRNYTRCLTAGQTYASTSKAANATFTCTPQ